MRLNLALNTSNESGITPIGLETDLSNGIKSQDYFHQMLELESMRAERSGKPSLLMSIDFRNFRDRYERRRAVAKTDSLLSSLIRSTDIRGWYLQGVTVGVIFTELGGSNLTEAREKTQAKIKEGFEKIFSASDFRLIRIGFTLLVPENSPAWKRDGVPDLGIYPENPPRTSLRRETVQLTKNVLRSNWFLGFVDLLCILRVYLPSTGIVSKQAGLALDAFPGMFVFLVLPNLLFLFAFDLYNMDRIARKQERAYCIILASFLAAGFSEIFASLSPDLRFQQGSLIRQVMLVSALLIVWREIYRGLLLPTIEKAKLPTVIIGSGDAALNALELIRSSDSPFDVKGFLDDYPALGLAVKGRPGILGPIKKLIDLRKKMGIEAVVLATTKDRVMRITSELLAARMSGITVIDMPTLHEKLTGRLPVEYIDDQWLLNSTGFDSIAASHNHQRAKRILDFICCALLSLIIAPVIGIAAIAIRLNSPGPIFYAQQRVGKRGKVFTVYKLRSMRTDAEQNGVIWAKEEDPRVTGVGRWLRKFRIDEFPQLWNVLKGEMSLVGPRPERPEFVQQLEAKIPYYGVRHTIMPGLTGWAQISYPYGASAGDALRKLEYDLYYIKHLSIPFDIKILIRTIGVVLTGEGAR